jgi:hypothetical protein
MGLGNKAQWRPFPLNEGNIIEPDREGFWRAEVILIFKNCVTCVGWGGKRGRIGKGVGPLACGKRGS